MKPSPALGDTGVVVALRRTGLENLDMGMETQIWLNKRWPPVSYANCGSSSATLGSERPEGGYVGPGRDLQEKTPKGTEGAREEWRPVCIQKQRYGEEVTWGHRGGLKQNPGIASILCLEALKEGGNET